MFTWTDRELNKEQSEAVREPGSVFLVACPGSGKTRTLTYKLAYELSRLGSGKKYVVAITYTHRAADEIRERIEDLGVETERLWIGTIHSFCLEWILKPYGIYLPELAHGYSVIDLHAREKLFESLCKPYASQRLSFYDCDYYFTDDGYYLGCQDSSKHESLGKVLKRYFQILTDSRQIDFELMLWHASRLLRGNPAICTVLSKIFSTILVDEYQDTKHIQYCILSRILKAGQGETALFMVGDPNQAIYNSLGGYPIEVNDLRAMTGLEIAARELSSNYRSSSRIVRYFGNFRVYDTKISAEGRDRDYPSSISYRMDVSRDGLVSEIVRLIRRSVEELGIPANEVCVLAPQWVHLAAMTRKLVTALPDYEFDGPGMVPFARDIDNFWYKLSRLALTEPSPAQYVRRLRWSGDVISDLRDVGVDMSGFSRKSLLAECNSIAVAETNGLNFLRRFFDEFLGRVDIEIEHYPQLHGQHEAFFASSQARIDRLASEGVEAIGEIGFFKKVFQNRRGITVSTIHGVKGAEFDVVIAYALLEGMVPHFNDQDGEASGRKLLYVVGSRAKKHLHLFSETGRARGRYNTYTPTLSLAGLVFDYDQP